jgi:hypothetical protein
MRPATGANPVDHPEAPQGERGVHVADGRSPARRLPGRRRGGVRRRVRRPVHDAGHRRPPRRARGGPRRVRAGAPAGPGGRWRCREHRRRVAGALTAGVPVRAVHEVRRGPPPRAARGRAHGPGHRHVPRRLDARGRRRRAGRRQPLRRRPGDHRPPPGIRAHVDRRAPRPPGVAAERARAHPQLHRGDAADREPRQGGLPAGAGPRHRGRGRHPRRNHRDGAQRRGEPGPAPLRRRFAPPSPGARNAPSPPADRHVGRDVPGGRRASSALPWVEVYGS